MRAADKNSIAHANFLNETSHRGDIRLFMEQYRPAALPVVDTFPIAVVGGANNDQGPYTQEQRLASKNVEATMDSELQLSITWPTLFEAINVFRIDRFYGQARSIV